MADIKIGGVRMGSDTYHVHVVLTETQEVEGQPQEVAIGEAFIPFPKDTTVAQAKPVIIAKANEIMAEHKRAKLARETLEEETWPEIT